ncbi:MAG: YdcF family protein [Bacteroidales bacterium]|nr:YdcF family protein [Bacteroidales bacterium]
MFFVISKILSFALSPIIWIFTILIFAFFIKNKKKSKRLLLVSILMFLFFSNSFITDGFIRLWERPVIKIQDIDKIYDVGIVLGGGIITYEKQTDKLTFRSNVDRIMQAVELYKKGKIKNILISGGPGSLLYRDMYEAVLLKRFLVGIDIPDSIIYIDSMSNNTHQNALFSKEIIDENFLECKFLLITSAIHMKRAKACFSKAGIEVDEYCTNKYVGEKRYQFDYLFVPFVVNFLLWDELFHEVIGSIVYSIMGYT